MKTAHLSLISLRFAVAFFFYSNVDQACNRLILGKAERFVVRALFKVCEERFGR